MLKTGASSPGRVTPTLHCFAAPEHKAAPFLRVSGTPLICNARALPGGDAFPRSGGAFLSRNGPGQERAGTLLLSVTPMLDGVAASDCSSAAIRPAAPGFPDFFGVRTGLAFTFKIEASPPRPVNLPKA
jgi:hypothetical protein